MVMGGGKMRPILLLPIPGLWDCDSRIEQLVGFQRGSDEDVYWFDSCYSRAHSVCEPAALSG